MYAIIHDLIICKYLSHSLFILFFTVFFQSIIPTTSTPSSSSAWNGATRTTYRCSCRCRHGYQILAPHWSRPSTARMECSVCASRQTDSTCSARRRRMKFTCTTCPRRNSSGRLQVKNCIKGVILYHAFQHFKTSRLQDFTAK